MESGRVRSRTVKGARTFTAIQDAAVELIYEHGFEKMTSQMLARKAGIEKATLYHHIVSKEDLLFQILKRGTSEGVARSLLAEREDRPDRQLRLFIQLSIRTGLKRRKETVIATSELRSLAPQHRRILRALQRSHSDILRGIIERGMADGTFKVADSRIATAAIQQMLTGISTWYQPEGRLTEEELIRIYTDLVLGMVGMSAPAAGNSAAPELPPQTISNVRTATKQRI